MATNINNASGAAVNVSGLTLTSQKMITSTLLTNYDFYAQQIIYGNNQFFGNTNYPEAQSPSMAMIPFLWYDNDSYLGSTNALGNLARLAKYELDFATSTTATNFPASYVHGIVQFVYNLATGYTYERVFQDLFVDGNATVKGSLSISNGVTAGGVANANTSIGYAWNQWFPLTGSALNDGVFSNYPTAGFAVGTLQSQTASHEALRWQLNASPALSNNTPVFGKQFISLNYFPDNSWENSIELRQKVRMTFDTDLQGNSVTNGNFVGTFTGTNSQVIISGTTNQMIFGGTNTPPVSTNLVVWISVQIVGDTNRYRLGLAK